MIDHGQQATALYHQARQTWNAVRDQLPWVDGPPADDEAREVVDLRARNTVFLMDIEMSYKNLTVDTEELQAGVRRVHSVDASWVHVLAEGMQVSVDARLAADELKLSELVTDMETAVDQYSSWAQEHQDRFAELRIALAEE